MHSYPGSTIAAQSVNLVQGFSDRVTTISCIDKLERLIQISTYTYINSIYTGTMHHLLFVIHIRVFSRSR